MQNTGKQNQQHQEGKVARTIEDQTAKLPSDAFLWTSIGLMGVSLILQIAGKKAHKPFCRSMACANPGNGRV